MRIRLAQSDGASNYVFGTHRSRPCPQVKAFLLILVCSNFYARVHRLTYHTDLNHRPFRVQPERHAETRMAYRSPTLWLPHE